MPSGTKVKREEMLGSGIEIRWRIMPADFQRESEAHAVVISKALKAAGYTGTWIASPLRKFRCAKAGEVFAVKGVAGGAIRIRVKPSFGPTAWNMTISPPAAYVLHEVAGKLTRMLMADGLDDGFDNGVSVANGEDDWKEPAKPIAPAVLALQAPQALQPAPVPVVDRPVDINETLERISRLHTRARAHQQLIDVAAAVQKERDEAWARLEALELAVLEASEAVKADADGVKAVLALQQIGGLL